LKDPGLSLLAQGPSKSLDHSNKIDSTAIFGKAAPGHKSRLGQHDLYFCKDFCQPLTYGIVIHTDSKESWLPSMSNMKDKKMKKLIAALVAGLFATASFAASHAAAPATPATPATPAAAPAASADASAPKAKKVKKVKKAKKAAATK